MSASSAATNSASGKAKKWIHYSVDERVSRTSIEPPAGRTIKFCDAWHFAIDAEWLELGYSIKAEVYGHKYELTNFDELRILEISSATVNTLLPPAPGTDGAWCFDWKAVADQGYDGVYIHHWDVYECTTCKNRWRYWVHCFDIDTLVVWRNAEMREVRNDWPAVPSPDVLELKRRIAAMVVEMTDDERAGAAQSARRSREFKLAEIERYDAEQRQLAALVASPAVSVPHNCDGVSTE